jgi:D-alanyl-D-alanine dipeptidase
MRKMLKSITIILVEASLIVSCTSTPRSSSTTIVNEDKSLATKPEKINVRDASWTEIVFDKQDIIEKMAYADTNNFMGEKIYPCARCFLRVEAAEALLQANVNANQKGLKLILFDCYRPTMYQQKMYDLIKDSRYVAEPKQGGSMHNKGLAIDIALSDSIGNMLDFGGEFDDFSEKSHHAYSQVDSLAFSHRLLLKKIMMDVGFSPYPYEWWHYSFKQIDYTLDDYVWDCNE